MRKPSASTVVIALLLGILLGVAFANVLSAKSSAQANDRYDHLAFVAVGEGGVVWAVDVRNGDVWRVDASYPERSSMALGSPRTSTVDPSYLGNLGLDRLDEMKAKRLESFR